VVGLSVNRVFIQLNPFFIVKKDDFFDESILIYIQNFRLGKFGDPHMLELVTLKGKSNKSNKEY
jgi:hypothetical protein